MDIIDEHKDKSGENNPLSLPKPCVIPPSINTMEHIIPQMIITSADDSTENNQNGYEISTSEIHSSEISSDVSTQKEIENVHSNEEVGQTPTICTEQAHETRLSDMKSAPLYQEEAKSQDFTIHTAVQRPLIIESERSVSPSTITELDSVGSKDTQISDPVPTTMQRPLIFDPSHVSSETSIKPIEQENEDVNKKETSAKEISSGDETLLQQFQTPTEYEIESSSFVPPHTEKDNFSYRDLDERDDVISKGNGDFNKESQFVKEINQSNVKKEGLQNVKKFFDSLLHESHPEKNLVAESSSVTDGSNIKSNKSEKHSIKKFFSSSKSDGNISEKSTEQKSKKESHEQSGDSKYNIKKMFDSFKSDSSEHKSKAADKKNIDKFQDEKVPDPLKPHKDSKSGMKKFFDSFKHENTNVASTEESTKKSNEPEISIRVPVSFPKKEESSIPKIEGNVNSSNVDKEHYLSNITEQKELKKEKQIDTHGIKKFFDSFKHDKPHTSKDDSKISHSEVPEKKSTLRKSHSFRESLLGSETKDIEKEANSTKSVKSFFESFKQEGTHSSSKDLKEQKKKELKRSQSFKERIESTEVSHGFRAFLDSLRHKKTSSQSTDHIYDVVEKTVIPEAKPGDVASKSTSSKIEENKKDTFKIFSDSGVLKGALSKSKTSECPKKVRMSDDITTSTSSETNKTVNSAFEHISNENTPIEVSNHESKNISQPKETPPKVNIKKQTNIPSIQISSPSSQTETMSSMLNSFTDNLSALKDKIFQPKEDKKSKVSVTEKEAKIKEYDLEIAAKSEHSGVIAGTYRPINDSFVENVNADQEVTNSSLQGKDVKSPLAIKSAPDPIALPKPTKKPQSPDSTSKQKTPDTLYDTCCFKLAVLFSNKAIEMVSDKSKIPPKKPPKPTAEAIARARANVVSRRLREMQYKGQSIGENIPVGYDGIRFADDETESSCDYKDVDNFDYIMDYELINRYKFDNKLDTFSDPSSCSGSYYTADTVTLKDETFSDAPLETISLGSNDSHLLQNLSLTKGKSDGRVLPATSYKINLENKSQSSSKSFAQKHEPGKTICNDTKKFKSSIPTPKKKIPPPLPPKPTITSKQKNLPLKKTENTPVSECINGLSLSPRLKPKIAKDAAATQKRPLLVAGLKETEFPSLQTKSKDYKIQAKDRKFDMVLKNESLKKIHTISSDHKPLMSTKSTPEMSSEATNFDSLNKKSTPQRPPLPVCLNNSDPKKLRTAPKVPEKPKRENASSPIIVAKRTVSPPRPPPPTSIKLSGPPPRPPPPITNLQSPENVSSQVHQDQKTFSVNQLNGIKYEESTSVNTLPTILLKADDNIENDSGNSKHDEQYQQSEPEILENFVAESKLSDTANFQVIDEHKKDISSQNFITENTCKNIEQIPKEEQVNDIIPKPPLRTRRIRSRTVEVTRVEEVPQQTLRRSQSLSEIDVQKRTSYLSMPNEKTDLKHLYTSVNKNGKKSTLSDSQSSLEKLSGRPLPAPPPPPRKFRSLDRKPKTKEKTEPSQTLENIEIRSLDRKPKAKEKPKCSQMLENGENSSLDCKSDIKEKLDYSQIIEDSVVNANINQSDLNLHPPVRKKKSDQHRFHSLDHDHARNDSETLCLAEDSKMSRSLSVPLRPKRRTKQSNVEYDENANVSFPVQAEVHLTDIVLDECGNEMKAPNIPNTDAIDSIHFNDSIKKIIPNPRRKKEKNPKEKSHSSWYDESQPSEEFEIVDWTPVDEAESKFYVNSKNRPTRRCSDPGKGRRTSKFYIDVQSETELFPLVDKETSPVPLDCSEKSVQTSLETLSQGMTSRDEGSDDTDDLLDLAQTLQNELKVIINRHKSTSDVGNDSSAINTPILSATDSEDKNSFEEPKGSKLKISPSIRSSNSEVWPLTSSEESDSEISPRRPENLTEIALKRNERKIFYIAQEIMTSETTFVNTLKLLNEDFKAAVELANQQKGVAVIPEEVLSQILNHLPQLQHLNENLLMELKDRIDNWDKVGKIADVIVKMGPFLKLYSWYIHDFESNLSLLEDSKKRYPLFAQVVKEFEGSARCKRLALNHFMLKPIQRIPQYRLLLQEYLHHLPEDHIDYKDTVAALQIVSEVATHANDSMKHGDNAQKLISIQNSIMGHKEIIKPGRLFVKEGELMKLSRKGMQPRWFVLFNDLLLYLTPVQQGLFRVNHELPLTGMKVAIPIQQDYQNEFSIISVARSFTLAARSPEERQEWIIALTKAIEENASKRSTFTNIRLQQKHQEKVSEEDEGEFILGKKAPVWIPDARVTMCQLCTSEFTVTFRRHHCRACGKVVCSICSSNRISLPYLGNRIARVCDDCHSKLGPGSGTCTESAETDSDNQQIAVKPHLRTEHRPVKKGKRNLPSVLKEVCANDQGSTISGYLQKKAGKSWKREWFVIKDKVLYEYKASEDVAALRSLPLLGYKIESFSEAHESIDPSLLFQLTHSGQAPIIFHADTVGSTERWISALKEASVLE